MKTVQGNLLNMFDSGEFDVIVHGCNCHKDMGGGIAAQIKERYPQVHWADIQTAYGAEQKLGQIDPVMLSGWGAKWFPNFFKRRFIINAYTQYNPGRDGNLAAIELAFRNLAEQADSNGWGKWGRHLKIGIPAIGCGIAGLEWAEVEQVIERTAGHLDITYVEFDPN